MARSYDHLYPQLTSFENLYLAFRKAAKGKRGQPSVAVFEFNLEENLLLLQDELRAGTYRPGAYASFYISDPKRRLISAAPFRDRVVHHALCNIIEPVFERTFIEDSFANRVGKGTHRALDRAQGFARRYPFVLQCDIRQFFPSVDHAILFDILARKIGDARVLELCNHVLQSGEGILAGEYEMVYFPQDDPTQGSGQGLLARFRPRGLPIGNLTSQFWANLYLNELDQFVKRQLRCPAYLRYVDDFLLFSSQKSELWAWKDGIREQLIGLRLCLHERRSTVYPVANGIPFLGFRVYPTHRLLKQRNKWAFARRLRGWYSRIARGEMQLGDMERRIQGWVAHARHGDTWSLRRVILGGLVPRSGVRMDY